MAERATTRPVLLSHAEAQWTDEALVARARAGDAWAKEAIFRRYAASLIALVTRLLGSRDEAEDIVQDAFVVVIRDLERLRDPSSLRAWLTRIAVHKVHRRYRRRRVLSFIGLGSISDASLAALAAPTASPEVRAELALLDRVLAELSSHERLAWMLHHVEGETIESVAVLLGCSTATVKRRIKAAGDRIKAHVDRGSRGRSP